MLYASLAAAAAVAALVAGPATAAANALDAAGERIILRSETAKMIGNEANRRISNDDRRTKEKKNSEKQQSDDQERWLVGFHKGKAGKIGEVIRKIGGAVRHRYRTVDAMSVRLPRNNNEKSQRMLEKIHGVRYVEKDSTRHVWSVSEETRPWPIDSLQIPQVWNANNKATTGEGSVVCVIDGGLSMEHEDLKEMSVANQNPYSEWQYHGCNHGNHISGIIGGITGNKVGIQGSAPKSTQYIVRIFENTQCSDPYTSDLLAAAEECVFEGNARIINMALGSNYESPLNISNSTEGELFDTLYHKYNVLSVAAAGNAGDDSLSYPASYPSVLSVTAVDQANQVASFAQHNSRVDLAAPGVGVNSTIVRNGREYQSEYTMLDGTSMATAYVSGVAALLMAANPDASAKEVRRCLEKSALDLGKRGRDDYFGFGVVQACEAHRCITGDKGSCDPSSVYDNESKDYFGTDYVISQDTDQQNSHSYNNNNNNNNNGGLYAMNSGSGSTTAEPSYEGEFDESNTPVIFEVCTPEIGSIAWPQTHYESLTINDSLYTAIGGETLGENMTLFIRIQVEHTWLADLEIAVTNDQRSEYRYILTDACGSIDDIRAVFSDVSQTSIYDVCFDNDWSFDREYFLESEEHLIDQYFTPNDNASSLLGNWTFRFVDDANGDDGLIGPACVGLLDTTNIGGGNARNTTDSSTSTSPSSTTEKPGSGDTTTVSPGSTTASSSDTQTSTQDSSTLSSVEGEFDSNVTGIIYEVCSEPLGTITNYQTLFANVQFDNELITATGGQLSENASLFVRFDAQHTYIADLEVSIKNDVRTEYQFVLQDQCGSVNDIRAVFSDTADDQIEFICVEDAWDYAREFFLQPLESLDSYFLPANNDANELLVNWTIRVYDDRNMDTGDIGKVCIGVLDATAVGGGTGEGYSTGSSSTTEQPQTTAESGSTTTSSPQTTTNSGSTTTSEAQTTSESASTTTDSPQTTSETVSTTTNDPQSTTESGSTTTDSPQTTGDSSSTTTSGPQTTSESGSTTTSEPQSTTETGSTTTSSPQATGVSSTTADPQSTSTESSEGSSSSTTMDASSTTAAPNTAINGTNLTVLYEVCSDSVGAITEGQNTFVSVQFDSSVVSSTGGTLGPDVSLFVRLDIMHTWLADLEIAIKNDQNNTYRFVIKDQCGSRDDIRGIFSDVGTSDFEFVCVNSGHSYDDEYFLETLESLDNYFLPSSRQASELVDTNWTVRIYDDIANDDGVIGPVCVGLLGTALDEASTTESPVSSSTTSEPQTSSTEVSSSTTVGGASTTTSVPQSTSSTESGSTTTDSPQTTGDSSSTTTSGPQTTSEGGSTTTSDSQSTTQSGSTTTDGPQTTTEAGSTTTSGPDSTGVSSTTADPQSTSTQSSEGSSSSTTVAASSTTADPQTTDVTGSTETTSDDTSTTQTSYIAEFDEDETPIIFEVCTEELGVLPSLTTRFESIMVGNEIVTATGGTFDDNTTFFVRFDANHTWLADLEVSIKFESRPEYQFVLKDQCSSRDHIRAVFVDVADMDIWDVCFDDGHSYQREYLLESFESLDSYFMPSNGDASLLVGNYTLQLTDDSEFRDGYLGPACVGLLDTSNIGGGNGGRYQVEEVTTEEPETTEPQSTEEVDPNELPFPIIYEKCSESQLGVIDDYQTKLGEINDLNSTAMELISDGTSVQDLSMFVRVYMEHGWVGDFEINLLRNDETEGVSIWYYECNNHEDLYAIFTDAVSTDPNDLCDTSAWDQANETNPFVLAPDESIDDAYAPDQVDLVNSDWVVEFVDAGPGDSGFIDRVCVGWIGNCTAEACSDIRDEGYFDSDANGTLPPILQSSTEEAVSSSSTTTGPESTGVSSTTAAPNTAINGTNLTVLYEVCSDSVGAITEGQNTFVSVQFDSSVVSSTGGTLGPDVSLFVRLDIMHTWLADLEIAIKNDQNNTYRFLIKDECGSTDDIRAVFSDAGTEQFSFVCVESGHRYEIEYFLKSMDTLDNYFLPSSRQASELVDTNWTVRIYDDIANDDGEVGPVCVGLLGSPLSEVSTTETPQTTEAGPSTTVGGASTTTSETQTTDEPESTTAEVSTTQTTFDGQFIEDILYEVCSDDLGPISNYETKYAYLGFEDDLLDVTGPILPESASIFVRVDAEHTRLEDLEISVKNEQFPEYQFVMRDQCGSIDDVKAVFSDASDNVIEDFCYLVDYSIDREYFASPLESLDDYFIPADRNASMLLGNWTVRVYDDRVQDLGELGSFCVGVLGNISEPITTEEVSTTEEDDDDGGDAGGAAALQTVISFITLFLSTIVVNL